MKDGMKHFAPAGHKRWIIPGGYISATGHGPEPEMPGQETVSIINVSNIDAKIEIWIFYTDTEPVGPYQVLVPARRANHVRLNDLTDPSPIPPATDFAILIEADVAVVVQHTRLDSRQAENASMTSIAFADIQPVV